MIFLCTNDFAGYYSGLVSMTDDQIALVGYSSPAILIGFIFSLVLIMLPLLLGLRRIRGSMIISRSNSLIMSAACHVSILREVDSPSTKSRSMVRDDSAFSHIAEAAGPMDDWGQRTIADMSAGMEEGVELQPLISRSPRHSASSRRSTTQSEQASREVPADNITSIENESNVNSVDLEQDNRGTLSHGRDAEEHPLLSSAGSNRDSVNNENSNIGRNSDVKSNACTGETIMSEEDVDTESPRHNPITHAKRDHVRNTVSYLDTASDDDRIQAARKLEDCSDPEEDDTQFRIKISRSRIRWGVVRMPEEFYAQFEELEGVKLEHLSFGIEQQGVTAPEPGHHYA